MAIYMWRDIINFATQWPAPDGFHVPLNTEWQAIYDIWLALGGWSSDGTNFWANLKLPFAGYRQYYDASVYNVGNKCKYWASSPRNTNYAYALSISSSEVLPQNEPSRSYGYPVRCFRNSPIKPTSSWTKLYWTSIEAGWIFWSATDWLISLSSNWTTWITISDKNLWATTVWNSGDTLTNANCGNVFQRGNNYAFPWTKSSTSITTSSTQVDVTGYWPWNYYSSSTWITALPRQNSISDGNNLRWWVDGNIPV